MVKPAFAGDWDVYNYGLNTSNLIISGPLFSAVVTTELSKAIEELLQRDWRRRPDAIRARSQFTVFIEREQAVVDPSLVRIDDLELFHRFLRHSPRGIKMRECVANEYMRAGKSDLEIAVREDLVKLRMMVDNRAEVKT
jgi:hypothetical protein